MRDLLCAGELNVDLVLSGFHSMPVQGREIMGEDYTLCLGSSSANCCCVAASLGLSALFYGKLGQDHFGQVAMEGLKRYGVDTRLIRRDPGWRTVLTVCVSATGDRPWLPVSGTPSMPLTPSMSPWKKRTPDTSTWLPTFFSPGYGRGCLYYTKGQRPWA